MRRVFMNYPFVDTSNAAPRAREARLIRHLVGRMLELAEDGVRVIGSQDPFVPRSGAVCVDFTAMENAKIALLLAQDYGVTAALDPSGACVRFFVGPAVTFEDIDYVQGAILQILSRNQRLPP